MFFFLFYLLEGKVVTYFIRHLRWLSFNCGSCLCFLCFIFLMCHYISKKNSCFQRTDFHVFMSRLFFCQLVCFFSYVFMFILCVSCVEVIYCLVRRNHSVCFVFSILIDGPIVIVYFN